MILDMRGKRQPALHKHATVIDAEQPYGETAVEEKVVTKGE